MTKDQIAQWASEAEAHANTLFDWVTQEEEWHAARNERFAVLATAAEREACAQVCEGLAEQCPPGDTDADALHGAAAGIRARDGAINAEKPGEPVDSAIVRTVLPEAYSIINEMVRDAPDLQKSLMVRARKLLPETYSESFAAIRARGAP